MILIQLVYTLYTLCKVTVNELLAHNIVYYIEYCNFQFAVMHCLSIIHLKYYIEYIAECVLTLIYQIISITYCDFLFGNNNFVFGDTGFVVNFFTQNIIKFMHTITLKS